MFRKKDMLINDLMALTSEEIKNVKGNNMADEAVEY